MYVQVTKLYRCSAFLMDALHLSPDTFLSRVDCQVFWQHWRPALGTGLLEFAEDVLGAEVADVVVHVLTADGAGVGYLEFRRIFEDAFNS